MGSKALGLARLARAGLPVPRGYCITSSAYRGHIGNGAGGEDTSALAASIPYLSPGERRAALRALRQGVVAAPLGNELAGDIARMYRELGGGRVAVRSSATAEDLARSSFAGQYETLLDVEGVDMCLQAVKECWASIWTERAYEYRERNGFDHCGVDMAVIVQEMVAADAAGVIFTADPVTGRADRITIEAVPGLGDALVSGSVAPDRLVLTKRGVRVIAATLGGGARGGFCIGEKTAAILALMAMRAESALGCPLDVEWAAAGGSVFLLQARPVTALGRERSWEDRQVWSNVNTGEILPDVVTPATWSLVALIVFKVFGSIFGRIGLDFGDNPIVGQIAGRAYFNLNTMTGVIRSFPGMRHMDVGQALGGEQGSLGGDGTSLRDVSIPDEDIPGLDFGLGKALVRLPSFLAWFHSLSLDRGRAFIAEMRDKLSAMQRIDPASMGDEEIIATIGRVIQTMSESDAIIGVAARGMYYFMTLDGLCNTWLKDYRGISANRLCSGVEGMRSADAGYELWRLALAADADEGLREAVLSGSSFEALRGKSAESGAAAAFLAQWDLFMFEHGHHTRGELELRNRRWSEDPDYIQGILRGYLLGMERVDPLAKMRENETVRQELTARCRRLLVNPLKRRFFDYVLVQAQQGLVMRENVKSEAVRAVALARGLLLELGGRLAARGVLENGEDSFFLYLEELETLLTRRDISDLRGEIRRRRDEYERNMEIIPPKVIYGSFDPDDFIADEIDEDVELMEGLAVCPGVVTGPARVMLRSDEGHVLPGEIMVAPFTDPGWTPHFLTAAGIVMDLGGLLSHGSIVAREYGIPTVVNVGPATRIIKTGQMVQVDGTRGIVRILR